MIVWLASYPRSGNTFLRIVLATLYRQKSVSRYHPVGTTAKHSYCRHNPGLEAMSRGGETFLVKTHDLPDDEATPAIYVVRDGRDCLVSYAQYNFAKQGRPDIDVCSEEFRTVLRNLIVDRRSPFGTWSTNVLAWSRRPRTAVLRFEDFIHRPESVDKAVRQLGLDWKRLQGASVPPFDALRQLRPLNFRRGKVGAWREDLPSDLHALFWQHHGAVMDQFGYRRAA